MQLHAGYISDGIQDYLFKKSGPLDWKDILYFLSVFELQTNENLSYQNNESLFAVADNIISRGLPTKPSTFIEKSLAETFKWSKREINSIGEINFKLIQEDENLLLLLRKSFIYIDPRIRNINFALVSDSESILEKEFFENKLTQEFGDYSQQIIESQRSLPDIIKFCGNKISKPLLDLSIRDFVQNNAVDFSIQFPKNNQNKKNGIVIEIDDETHNPVTNQAQAGFDNQRDSVVTDNKVNWDRTVRLRKYGAFDEINTIPHAKINSLNNFLNHSFNLLLKNNYENPLYNSEEGLDALQIALTPFAVARIQKVIVQLIRANILSINSAKWNIAILERDLPCGKLAIEDLKQLLKNLFNLRYEDSKLPEIELTIYNTEEFRRAKLNNSSDIELYDESALNINEFRADILIDISILQRPKFTKPSNEFLERIGNPKVFIIRSCYAPRSERNVSFSKLIEFPNLLESKNFQYKLKSLKYFIRNIFRKIGFRQGQLEIINRALIRKSVIALLPTGAGKSLTYQFSSFLQPGITLIVDPIKSLMKDQNDNLYDLLIDNTVFINSTIRSGSEKDFLTKRLSKGFYQFCFISPERLQIKKFRDFLSDMQKENTHFSYCVIDEAHCVSEWGHDFRTAYLRLGENAREYCKTGDDSKITLIGLTGTASYDVLSDVQKELNLLNDSSAIIRPSSSERKELKFKILNVPINDIPINGNESTIRNLVGNAKESILLSELGRIPGYLNHNSENFFALSNEETKAGIIFCPHKKNKFGVDNVSNYIHQNFQSLNNFIGKYYGSDNDDENETETLQQTQDNFKRNKLSLLVATKAFGMGIDKPNIRYTFHYNMPQSIESFYQEAGRAGRDRDNSICSILYCNQILRTENEEEITYDKNIQLSFHRNSFRGIEKEKKILVELLEQISFPVGRQTEKLNLEILENLNLEVHLKLWQGNNMNRLYINGIESNTDYGFINLNDNNIQPSDSIVSKEDASRIINNIFTFLSGLKPENVDLISWLKEEYYQDPNPGIEEILNSMNLSDPPKDVIISFKNDKIRRIADLLSNISPVFDESLISSSNNFCFTFDKFVKNLKTEYWKKTQRNINFNAEVLESIKPLFKKIRDEADTYKAIYRLSIIGVIKDYTIEYNNKTITSKLVKNNDEHYISELKNYISKYVSREESERIPTQVLERAQGNTIIRKCLGFLIDFIYDHIARKRLESINVMENSCRVGITEGNEAFIAYVNTYFDSKYYLSLSQYLREFHENVIEDFILQTNGTMDNLNHLRGACDRLISDNPDNGAFLLLRAFANILLYDNELLKEKIIDDYRKGCKKYLEQLHLTRKKYLKFISQYHNHVKSYNASRTSLLELEIVKEQYNWLKNFNRKLLNQNQT